MQLELSEAERKQLLDLVEAAHTNLGAEIHHAEWQNRELYRERRMLLEGLRRRLEPEARAAA